MQSDANIFPKKKVIGNGVVLHLQQFFDELDKNVGIAAKSNSKAMDGWESRLLVSDRTHIVFDLHQVSPLARIHPPPAAPPPLSATVADQLRCRSAPRSKSQAGCSSRPFGCAHHVSQIDFNSRPHACSKSMG